MKTTSQNFRPHDLVREAVQITRVVHRQIRNSLQTDRARALGRVTIDSGGANKSALRIDLAAEERCMEEFSERYSDDIFVCGEEALVDDLSAVHRDRVCVLVDMVDGTDLLEMGIPMWCSAIVIFDPTLPKILGAVIGLATGEIYSASAGEHGAQVSREPSGDFNRPPNFVGLSGPSSMVALSDATLSFYGQKATNLLTTISMRSLQTQLKAISANKQAQFRIHTLSGNPMMVKLVDRERDNRGRVVGRGIDAIFDLTGQHLHDVVPGAYIAMKAGATLCDLNGNPLDENNLASRLVRPADTLKYILSATPELAREFLSLLGAETPGDPSGGLSA